MTDFNEILKQARQMQEKMQNAQKEAAKLVLVGESGAGLVRVHMNGHHDVQRVELDSGLLSEDKDVIEDLIAAAFNDAVKKLAERNQDSMAGLASGLKLPDGFKFPF
jgi:DNA-binding YbaB/EbfC family protein